MGVNSNFFLWIFLGVSLFPSNAQTDEIDSLQILIQNHKNKDTTKVILLNRVAEHYLSNSEGDLALEPATRARKIAEEIDYIQGEAESLFLLGDHSNQKGQHTTALEQYHQAIILFVKSGNKQREALIYRRIGAYYYGRGELDSTYKYTQNSLDKFIEAKDKRWTGRLYNDMGNVFDRMGNYPESINHYLKGLKIWEEVGDSSGIAGCLNDIGTAYMEVDEYDKCLNYLNRALKIALEMNDSYLLGMLYSNYISYYSNTQDYTKALEYGQKTLRLEFKRDYKRFRAYAFGGMADVFFKLDSLEKALTYSNEAIILNKELGDLYGLSNSYTFRAHLHTEQKEYQLALKYALLAQNIVDEQSMLVGQIGAYHLLSHIYSETGDYKKAYDYHVIHKLHNDSLFNEKDIEKIANLKSQYEFDKEKQAIEAAQQKKDALLTEKSRRQRIVRNSLMGGFTLMVILVLVVLRSFIQKKKANKLLNEKNDLISEQNEEILAQSEEILTQSEELKTTNEQLDQLVHFKEDMTNMIIHDLKSPLNAIINAKIINDGEEKDELIQQSGFTMLNLVQNVLDVYKYESATIKLDQNKTDLSSLLDSALSEVALSFKQRSLKIAIDTEQHSLNVDQPIIHRVIVNLLSNAVKFSPNGGAITIESAENEGKQVRISIINEGPGIPKEKQKHIFERFGQAERKVSGSIGSTGLGLTFCKLAVEAHGGEIGVISEGETGVAFWFTLPGQARTEKCNNSIAATQDEIAALAPDDRKYLASFINELKRYELFEISEINKVLNRIEKKNRATENWIRQVEAAVYVGDKSKCDALMAFRDEINQEQL